MTFDEIKSRGEDFSAHFSDASVGVYASSAAFFFFTALIPVAMLVCAILPYTSTTPDDLLTLLMRFLPATVEGFVSQVLTTAWEAATGGVIIVSLIIALWLASVSIMGLIRGFDAIYRVKKKQSYFVMRGFSCLYMLVFMVIIAGLMFLLMYGRAIEHTLSSNSNPALMTFVTYAIAALLLEVIFQCCYAFLPSERQPFKKQWIGAVFSAIVWTLTSYGYALYVSWPGAYSMYGNFATIIITLIYAYLMIYILLMGAEINAYLMDYEAKYVKGENTKELS